MTERRALSANIAGLLNRLSFPPQDLKAAIEKLDGTELNGRRIRLIEENKSKKRSRSRSRSRSPKRSRSRSPKKLKKSRSPRRSKSRSPKKSGSR